MSATLMPPDLEAAHHLLTAPPLAPAAGLDWDATFARAARLPAAARVLAAVAYEIVEGRRALSLWEIPATLDAAGMQRVIEALCLCHGGRGAAPDPARVAPAGRSPEHAAVAHLLASPRVANGVRGHIHADGFDWAGLLAAAATMSRAQRLLVDIAHDLWTRGEAVGVRELARGLDTGSFVRAVEALGACRPDFGAERRPLRVAA